MARDSTHFDRAHALAAQLLGIEAELDELEVDSYGKRELLQTRGIVEAMLAVAEALRGVVYVGDAGRE